MRLEIRREPMKRGEWEHERRANQRVAVGHFKTINGGWAVGKGLPAVADDFKQTWRDRVAASSDCYFDWQDGTYAVAPAWSPPKRPSPYAVMKDYARMAVRKIRRDIQHVGLVN